MSSVIGYYTTKFGELWDKSLFDLVEEAIKGVLENSRLERRQIDAIFFGNMLAGVLENNLHSPSRIAEIIGTNIPIFRVEAACASGGMAFHLANNYLKANPGKTVMVLGGEKMTDYSPEETTEALMSASSGEEQEAGLTFPGLYAVMANYYLEKYGYDEENLAYIGYKNHLHGSLNDRAHFQKKVSVEDVLKSSYVACPLKVLDCSPISDGAAAVIISNDKKIVGRSEKQIQILASEVATDTISLKTRKSLGEILSTKIAGDKAFKESKLNRKKINVAELHDCFSIAEILAMEDLGFWEKGEGGRVVKTLVSLYDSGSGLAVNTSGGLKAAGHPVGATGIKQIGEIFLQLTGQAGRRQVKKARCGLTQNVGGSGGTAVVSIFAV
jgi:acetyl-CoA C-acetyltransferase